MTLKALLAAQAGMVAAAAIAGWVAASPALSVGLASGVTLGAVGTALATGLARRERKPAALPVAAPPAFRPQVPEAEELEHLAESLAMLRQELHDRDTGLERVNADFRLMLDNIPEGVLAIDADERVLFANQSVLRLFNIAAPRRPDVRLWELIRHPRLREAVEATFASAAPFDTEFEILAPPRVLAFHGRRLAVETGRAVILVLRDMSELRRLERVRHEFFTNVSHELKTPLTAIMAFTETMLDGRVADPEVRQRFLGRIFEQADRLQSLVLDMLMLARVESADAGMHMRRLDACETALSTVQGLTAVAEARGLTLTAAVDPHGCPVQADDELLSVLLRNLLSNALKFTPAGGAVTVQCGQHAGQVRLAVTDTGVGIPEADVDRVFERFYRVDKARSRELGGTGLGLSIVKHIAQRFGGSVTASSRLGEGSTFTVMLPLAADELSPAELGDEEGLHAGT